MPIIRSVRSALTRTTPRETKKSTNSEFEIPESPSFPDAQRFSPSSSTYEMFKPAVTNVYQVGLQIPPTMTKKTRFEGIMQVEEKKNRFLKTKRSKGTILSSEDLEEAARSETEQK
mmetsp:Transcript_12126/g.32098  ORF Transcript_12126/g.32098 Transcript_12126/m.32098 type:complete len:116 (+) Transcript_12126:77-424(+)